METGISINGIRTPEIEDVLAMLQRKLDELNVLYDISGSLFTQGQIRATKDIMTYLNIKYL